MPEAFAGSARAIASAALLTLGISPATPTAAAQKNDLPAHFQPLAFLLGGCWRGTFADGATTDLRCYESVFSGKFLRERHVVRGGAGGREYRGETLYHWDAKTGKIHYTYWNSNGGVSTGAMEVDGSRRIFPTERYTGSDGKTREFRTLWDVTADTAWVMVTEELRADGQWTPAWRVAFRRDPLMRPEERP